MTTNANDPIVGQKVREALIYCHHFEPGPVPTYAAIVEICLLSNNLDPHITNNVSYQIRILRRFHSDSKFEVVQNDQRHSHAFRNAPFITISRKMNADTVVEAIQLSEQKFVDWCNTQVEEKALHERREKAGF